MPSQEKLFEGIESPLIRAFLRDNLCELANDVRVFSEQVLANVPAGRRPSVKDAGLAFYSAPIASLVPDLLWETVKAAIAARISGNLRSDAGGQGESEKAVPFSPGENLALAERIEQAIVTAFEELHKAEGGAVGLIVMGGIANLFGKYVALYIAGILLNEATGRQVNATDGATPAARAESGYPCGARSGRPIRNAPGSISQREVARTR